MANNYSAECRKALKLLARSKNVLVSAPPGTGKSRLLAEVALAFQSLVAAGPPQLNPTAGIPIPPSAGNAASSFPAANRTDRKVFRTVFHQNSKYRDFLSGITPAINSTAKGSGFTIVSGTLYNASEHAKQSDSASLLIIDEINRGPAVQVFGGSIVAIESDKRLAPDGSKRSETQFFELLEPKSGKMIEYSLPHDLYILAAMNQADASVEPLDVAFLRRWEPMKLYPSEDVLRTFYSHGASTTSLPAIPTNQGHALEVSVRAWKMVNAQISLGRGSDFQVGHGVLMAEVSIATLSLNEVLDFLCIGWAKVLAHIEEVFFGDSRGMAAAINALDGPAYNPFVLEEATFAGNLRFLLHRPDSLDSTVIYDCLRAFSRE